MKFGINLGFANNRYPEPEVWTKIVREIGLSDVQFVADILNPSLKKWDKYYYESIVNRTVKALAENEVTVSSMMTSTFTRVNHFAHPDSGYRKIWLDWFKEFALLGETFGAKKLGSHLGIMTINSERNDQNKIYDQTISMWAEFSEFAYDYGYECLFFEPMSVNREFCDTIEKSLKTYEDLNQISKIPVKICLDIGHAPHPTERDPYKWIKALASKSCIIHLQQTTNGNSNHSPFTAEFNRNGIIDGAKTMKLLRENGFDGDMIFEIGFKEKYENEPVIIDSLRESVEYWKNAAMERKNDMASNKAIVILDKNGNSEIQDREIPQPIKSQELLKVKACGICQSDIARFFNGGAHVYPLVIGHEFSGVSVDGNRHSIFPLIPCNRCDACKSRRFAQCESYSYYGSRQDGGMQQFILIDKWNLIDGRNLTYEQLATVEPCSVANNVVSRLSNISNRKILLNGCGFISLVTAQILAWHGAKIYFRNRNKTKLDFAEKKFGFQPWREGDKFDTAIDFVFNTDSIDFILNNISSFGEVICVGNPQGETIMSKQSCHLVLSKELKIFGVWNSIYDDWKTTIKLMEDHVIDVDPLITNRYDFKDYKKAFENILENQKNPKSLIIKSMLFFNE